jgi:hypothetical protein
MKVCDECLYLKEPRHRHVIIAIDLSGGNCAEKSKGGFEMKAQTEDLIRLILGFLMIFLFAVVLHAKDPGTSASLPSLETMKNFTEASDRKMEKWGYADFLTKMDKAIEGVKLPIRLAKQMKGVNASSENEELFRRSRELRTQVRELRDDFTELTQRLTQVKPKQRRREIGDWLSTNSVQVNRLYHDVKTLRTDAILTAENQVIEFYAQFPQDQDKALSAQIEASAESDKKIQQLIRQMNHMQATQQREFLMANALIHYVKLENVSETGEWIGYQIFANPEQEEGLAVFLEDVYLKYLAFVEANKKQRRNKLKVIVKLIPSVDSTGDKEANTIVANQRTQLIEDYIVVNSPARLRNNSVIEKLPYEQFSRLEEASEVDRGVLIKVYLK